MTLIRVPEGFAADTLTREGEAARTWLARLPELVCELCVRWGLRVTGDPMHGYMALVVPVLRGDARCALKVSWIDGETVNEADSHECGAHPGCRGASWPTLYP